MFKGHFKYCHDVEGNDLGLDKKECELDGGGHWRNPMFGSFDHIGKSLLMLFQIMTLGRVSRIPVTSLDVRIFVRLFK